MGIVVLLLFYGHRRAGTDLGSIMNYTELDMQDWQYEVANGDTLRGFHDWLAAQEEANA